MRIAVDLPCVPDSVANARDALERLDPELDRRTMADLRLLVSEVVTNAVRHAGLDADDSLQLRVERRRDRIRVEVTDPGRGFEPAPRERDATRPGGWGLFLVEELAAKWGVDGGRRTTVWFELTTS